MGKCRDLSSFFDFVLACKVSVALAEFELLCVLWWRIWFRRNQFVFSSVSVPVADMLEWARLYLDDFKKANQRGGCGPSRLHSVTSWSAPLRVVQD
jgi:hypothetical protein